MNESVRVDFVARIGCEGLELLLTQIQNGSELHVNLATTVANWGQAKNFLHGGYDYSAGEVKPGAWDSDEEPSNVLSYVGPILFESSVEAKPAKFCGECGQARANDGIFCISCGTKFRDGGALVGDLFDEIIRIKDDSLGLAEFVLRLYRTYRLAEIDTNQAAVLNQLLLLVAAKPNLVGFINGREDKPGENGEISVGQAQALSQKLKAGEALSAQELELARTILESAPITFGYWGAIKTALKMLPMVGNEKFFGVALANISNAPTVSPSVGDARFVRVGGMLDTAGIPSSRTLNYMARRICRDLKKLAETNPTSYIEISKHFALNWREPYRARSFAAGFIFHGGALYMKDKSRSINSSLNFKEFRRSEAFSELWNQNPKAALEMLSPNVKSSKALTLAFQIAEDLEIEVPELEIVQLNYAIKAPYLPLRLFGIAGLVKAKSSYEHFDLKTWAAVLRHASDEQITKLFERYRLSNFPVSSNSFMYAIQVFVAHYQKTGLANAEVPDKRLGRLAEFALLYPYELTWSNRLPILQVAISELGVELFDSNPNVLATFQNYELVALVKWLDSEGISFTAVSEAIIASSIRANTSFSYNRLSNITRFLELESNLGLEVAWAVLDADQSDDVALRLLSMEAIRNLSAKFKTKFVNQLILHTPITLLPDVLRTIQEQSDTWQGFDIISALGEESGPGVAWQILSIDSLPEIHRAIINSKPLIKAIGDSLQISEMKSASGAQAELAISYLANDKMRVKIDPEFVLAAATSANIPLSQAGLGTLAANKLISKYWIRLAESGLPDCIDACSHYLGTLGNTKELTASVLALLDSTTESAKKLGLSFLDSPSSSLDLDNIWSSLTESDDPEILARVAEEALVRGSIPDERLATMDRRVLVSRRKSRVAKESVKQRIDAENFELAPERVRALLELARAQNSRDREWAISRLAILSINGLNIPSFEAYEVSGAGSNG
jgi:hypothetical protein